MNLYKAAINDDGTSVAPVALTIKLPAAAVTALGKGAKESAMFRVAESNANGTGRATAKIATLKGAR